MDSKTPLSASAEASLNRDLSRRKALASAAASTKGGWEKRRAAMLKAIDTLKAQEKSATRSITSIVSGTAALRTRAEEEAEALSKAEASLATLENLQAQLHKRKAAILEERARVLQEDEEKRSALSDNLKERMAALDGSRLSFTPTTTTSTAEPPAAGDSAQAAADPYVENRRLRMCLVELADAFDADDKAFKLAMVEGAARRAALETDLEIVQNQIPAAEAFGTKRAAESQLLAESEKRLQKAIGAFTEKFVTFNDGSRNMKEEFQQRVQALTEANRSVREAEMDVRQMKLIRAEHTKELKSLKEIASLKKDELVKASEKTARMQALCDSLRDQIDIAPEYWQK